VIRPDPDLFVEGRLPKARAHPVDILPYRGVVNGDPSRGEAHDGAIASEVGVRPMGGGADEAVVFQSERGEFCVEGTGEPGEGGAKIVEEGVEDVG